ncbi:hypothetical protein BB561_001613 [Smittium simulii]|uniref:EKC/KEOPS complex subunit CGI121 n=1 Tax=Smittium simulii TaxID=133385 RepID=A0A2T9YTU4_9FUNG|nr:hypothetical protein BB561_003083 [Smittium simulii]PVU95767.1 hypothetical protein BB561_001613 [Smittium simulii]
MRVVQVEHLGKNHNLCFSWYKDVSDKDRILNLIMSRDPSITNLISDEFTLLIAAKRALINRNTNSLKTENIYSELLYCLSPTTKIKSAIDNFGVTKDFESIIIAKFDSDINTFTQELNSLQLGLEWTPSCSQIQGAANSKVLSEVYGFDSSKSPKDYNRLIWSSIAAKGFL